jgi:hypothetical protein
MKNRVELLDERLQNINNNLGDIDTSEFASKSSTRSVIAKEKLKNISDVISLLQKEISENDSIAFKDVYKKCNF